MRLNSQGEIPAKDPRDPFDPWFFWETPRNDLLQVRLREWSPERARAVAAAVGGRVASAIPEVRQLQIQIPESAIDGRAGLLEILRAHPDVAGMGAFDSGLTFQLRPRVRLSQPTNDSRLDEAWHLKRHNFFRAWRYTRGDPAIKVGVVDTGICDHVDLPVPAQGFGSGADATPWIGDSWTGGVLGGGDPTTWDYTDGISWGSGAPHYYDMGSYLPGDPPFPDWFHSHGMNTYGTLFARANNAEGVAGCCHGCTPWVLNGSNIGMNAMYAAQLKAAQDGCRVFSFSIGSYLINANMNGVMWSVDWPEGRYSLQLWHDVVEQIHAMGCLQIGAAGNWGVDHGSLVGSNTTDGWSVLGVESYPEEFHRFVNVSQTGTKNDDWKWGDMLDNTAPWQWSNAGADFGTSIELLAAGSYVLMPEVDQHNWGGGGWEPGLGANSYYTSSFGTSFSTPISAGAAALIASINPALTADQIKEILLHETDAGRHPELHLRFPNAGVLNAYKAVLKALTTLPANAGVVYPYIDFWGAGENTVYADGQATTTLNGEVTLEIGGYSTTPITRCELWVGATKVYDGPPAVMRATASAASPQALRVVAHRAGGVSTSETYEDVIVGSMAVQTPFTARRISSTKVGGTRPAGSTVTASSVTLTRAAHQFYVGDPTQTNPLSAGLNVLDPSTGVPTPSPLQLGAVTYPTATTWEAPITAGVATTTERFRARASTGESLFARAMVDGVYPIPGSLPDAAVAISGSASWLVEVA